jgi:hypothetical protein
MNQPNDNNNSAEVISLSDTPRGDEIEAPPGALVQRRGSTWFATGGPGALDKTIHEIKRPCLIRICVQQASTSLWLHVKAICTPPIAVRICNYWDATAVVCICPYSATKCPALLPKAHEALITSQ